MKPSFSSLAAPLYLSLISLGCHVWVRVRLNVTPSSCCSLECSVGCLSNNMSTAPLLDRSIDLDLLFCPLIHLTGAATPCWAPRPQGMILPAVWGQATTLKTERHLTCLHYFYAVDCVCLHTTVWVVKFWDNIRNLGFLSFHLIMLILSFVLNKNITYK